MYLHLKLKTTQWGRSKKDSCHKCAWSKEVFFKPLLQTLKIYIFYLFSIMSFTQQSSRCVKSHYFITCKNWKYIQIFSDKEKKIKLRCGCCGPHPSSMSMQNQKKTDGTSRSRNKDSMKEFGVFESLHSNLESFYIFWNINIFEKTQRFNWMDINFYNRWSTSWCE